MILKRVTSLLKSKNMNKTHFVSKVISNPTDPVSITIIGCGGTGTRLISELVRINVMLLKIEHIGIHVTIIDGDTVSETNVGRQLYYEDDIGKYKAEVTATRINQNYGFTWDCVNEYIDHRFMNINMQHKSNMTKSNITISCVDKIEPRLLVNKILNIKFGNTGHEDYQKRKYWIDCGNTHEMGQVILGTIGVIDQPNMEGINTVDMLPSIMDIYNPKDFEVAKAEEDVTPSCSTYEAIERQDPFINSTIAMLTAGLVWKMIKKHIIYERGYYVDLSDPIPIKAIPI
jgi:PRTRC genetic system ThiF family protein